MTTDITNSTARMIQEATRNGSVDKTWNMASAMVETRRPDLAEKYWGVCISARRQEDNCSSMGDHQEVRSMGPIGRGVAVTIEGSPPLRAHLAGDRERAATADHRQSGSVGTHRADAEQHQEGDDQRTVGATADPTGVGEPGQGLHGHRGEARDSRTIAVHSRGHRDQAAEGGHRRLSRHRKQLVRRLCLVTVLVVPVTVAAVFGGRRG